MLVNQEDPLKAIHEKFNQHDRNELPENMYIPAPKRSFWDLLEKIFMRRESSGEPIGEPNCRTIYPD